MIVSFGQNIGWSTGVRYLAGKFWYYSVVQPFGAISYQRIKDHSIEMHQPRNTIQ